MAALKPVVDKYKSLENQISVMETEIKNKCKHPFKYIVSRETDSYEGRSYINTLCPTCGKRFEDRSSNKYKHWFTELQSQTQKKIETN